MPAAAFKKEDGAESSNLGYADRKMAARTKSRTKRRPEQRHLPKGLSKSLPALAVLLTVGVIIALRTVGSPSAATPPIPVAPRPPQYLSPEQQLDVPETEINFGVAALALTRDYMPGYDVAEGLKKLDEIAARIRALLDQQPDGDDPMVRIAAINTVLYREYQFTYDLTDFPRQTPEKRLLGNLLQRGKGTCANLPDLYYAAAERLGFPIYMVEAPQHVFLRYVLPNGGHINIEATGAGGHSPDQDYIAEMEIPKKALDSGTFMRTLSRREALYLLMQERTLFDERRGTFERVLAEGGLLRELRPSHAPTFWNSAVWEAIAGRATRELAKDEPEFAAAAEESFARARTFAKKAMELGVMKPDNKGEYVHRQEAIRLQRLGETAAVIPRSESWDALTEIEDIISAPPNTEFDLVKAYRMQNPNVPHRRVLDPATEKELAVLREVEEIERYNAHEQARMEALVEALQRHSTSVRQEDKLKALEEVTKLLGAPRQVVNETPKSSKLGRTP